MPANSKYFSSPKQRVLKITAAIFGGYFVAASFHFMIATIKPIQEIVILFSSITFFLLWGILTVTTFLARSGWKIWGIYLLLTTIFGVFTWILK